jgi:hypothetical protein
MFKEDKYRNMNCEAGNMNCKAGNRIYMPSTLLKIGNDYRIETYGNNLFYAKYIKNIDDHPTDPCIKFLTLYNKGCITVHWSSLTMNYYSASFASILPDNGQALLLLYALDKQNIYLDADSILMLCDLIKY